MLHAQTCPRFTSRMPRAIALGLAANLFIGALIGFAPLATADDDGERGHYDKDHDVARAALERGDALPLAEVLTRVAPNLSGEVVGIELDREDGRLVYELKVIAPNGRVREVYVDAATAEIVEEDWDD
jgi:uncharacterized membrane protein YkoI